MKPTFATLLLLLSLACVRASKPAAVKHYPLAGKVVSVNAKDQTAAIDASAIPNFMEAMTMDYPIKSKTEFASLHPGDRITATVDVSDDGSYVVTQIKQQPSAKK